MQLSCRILPDLMGRTLQIVAHGSEQLVCFVQKSTKALVMEVRMAQGSWLVANSSPSHTHLHLTHTWHARAVCGAVATRSTRSLQICTQQSSNCCQPLKAAVLGWVAAHRTLYRLQMPITGSLMSAIFLPLQFHSSRPIWAGNARNG